MFFIIFLPLLFFLVWTIGKQYSKSICFSTSTVATWTIFAWMTLIFVRGSRAHSSKTFFTIGESCLFIFFFSFESLLFFFVDIEDLSLAFHGIWFLGDPFEFFEIDLFLFSFWVTGILLNFLILESRRLWNCLRESEWEILYFSCLQKKIRPGFEESIRYILIVAVLRGGRGGMR